MSESFAADLQRVRELIDRAAASDPDAAEELQAMIRSLSTEELTALWATLDGES